MSLGLEKPYPGLAEAVGGHPYNWPFEVLEQRSHWFAEDAEWERHWQPSAKPWVAHVDHEDGQRIQPSSQSDGASGPIQKELDFKPPVRLILAILSPADAQQLLEDLEPIQQLLESEIQDGRMDEREARRWLRIQILQGIISKRRLGALGWLLRITGMAKLLETLLENWPLL